MRIELPTIFSQQDPQWSKTLLGNNTDPLYNFYNYGCLITSLAMICRYYGKDETPATLNEKLKGIGGFVNGGDYVHGSITKLYPDITEVVVNTPDPLTDAQLAQMKETLDAKHPLIIGLDYNPKTITPDYHFSTVVDYNPDNENDLTLADPLGGRTHSLRDYLAWFKPDVRKTVEKYFIYSGPLPQVPEAVVEPEQPTEQPQPVAVEQPVVAQAETAVLPANYADIVHGSDAWDQIVAYLELEKKPAEASFENAKRVIAGIKSRQVDLDNQRVKAEKRIAELEVTLANQKEDIGRLQQEVTRNQKLYKAEIDGLKNNTPSFENLKRQYDSAIGELKGNHYLVIDELKKLRIAYAEYKAGVLAREEGEVVPEPVSKFEQVFPTFVSLAKRMLMIRW